MVVVGAGPAGTLVADHLVSRGRRVALLDAGPRPNTDGAPAPVDEAAWRYRLVDGPGSWLRVRALGGASQVWGGWCNRHSRQVFASADWFCTPEDMDTAYRAVEAKIGVRARPLDAGLQSALAPLRLPLRPQQRALQPDGSVWRATHLPVSAQALGSTPALGLTWRTDGRSAEAVQVLEGAGPARPLRARAFVLAASPIETARLLMAGDGARRWPRLGRGLTLHPVQGYALFSRRRPPWSAEGSSAAFVPRFVNRSEKDRRPYPGGFGIEIQGPLAFDQIAEHLRERLGAQDRLPQNPWVTLIHAMGETFAHEDRWMDLDPVERDTLGRPIPRIRLGWNAHEHAMAADMRTACLRIAETLAGQDDEHLVHYLDSIRTPMLFHEAGTCAMGRAEEAVCDPRARVRGLDNVWVADASALPSPGDAHPTLTLLAHAWRCAQDVERHLAAA